jgi:UDP-N-acetylglucosamine/UDP-N-acetylgalactosamine diphosphorylase
MALTFEMAWALLAKQGQEHVLGFWDQLDGNRRQQLLSQIEQLDFDSIDRMRRMILEPAAAAADDTLEPAPVLSLTPAQRSQALAIGEEALRRGKVGVLLVAGGQGSRLGFEGPKGIYAIGPISGASLFEIHSRKILALEQKYATRVPFYIMTSETNDGPTRAFFDEHRYFGLAPDRVHFFIQGMWPALTADGRIILEKPDSIFRSPDGHGGILSALRARGAMADMERRGLETLFYFQVDNPLVEVADPAFIGIHRKQGSDISIKVCAKRDPDEGLGVVVSRAGKQALVEYTELTREQKDARLPDGHLRFRFGSVAIHVFDFAFLKREADAALPLHVAHKKVPHCDAQGRMVKPDKPNAYKFEKFIFDVIPDAARALNVEFAREDEFSPVKNATGQDSPETTRRDMVRKSARWLEACGVAVPRGSDGEPLHKIEIDPCYACTPDDLKGKPGFMHRLDSDLLLGRNPLLL